MKAAIFDLDGTMVDNMMVHHYAWQQVLAEQGLEMGIEEVKEKVHGINEEILEKLFGNRFTREERQHIAARKEALYREKFRKDLRLIPGCMQLLEQLSSKGVPMAIASAAPEENVAFVIDHVGIRPILQAILHAKSVTNGKPDPEIYLKAADALGKKPEQCIVFEDSPIGALAAARAGCQLVVVTTTHSNVEFEHVSGICAFINDFNEFDINMILN